MYLVVMISFLPMLRLSLFSPLAFLMAATVVPYFFAIEDNVSPFLTLCVVDVAAFWDFVDVFFGADAFGV